MIINKTPRDAAIRLVQMEIKNGFKFAALYEWTNEKGEVLYWVIRLDPPPNHRKEFRPMHIDEQGKYALGLPSFPNGKPLYRLHVLISRLNEPVFICEGEKCVEALEKLGLLATTSGSAQSAEKADWAVLAGREVIIWPDNDEAGKQYVSSVVKILMDLQCQVKIIDIASLPLPIKGDAYDWLEKNNQATKDDIFQLPLITTDSQQVSGVFKIDVAIDYPRFEIKDDGVYFCKDLQNSTWICGWLVVIALTRDSNGVNWGRALEFTDADNITRQWTMPMELLGGNGEELTRELLRLGLRIAPGGKIRQLLVEYITKAKIDQRARCVLRTGWHEKLFILPDKVFGLSDEIVLLQSDNQIDSSYCLKGTLTEWQQNIAALCVENSRLAFAISLAFAGTLLNIASIENGGFHFRGESSTGKTTALRVAASVWGGKSYVQNWRATDNGLEGLAAQHNDTLLLLDELSQIDPKCAGEVAYMLANGQGKARATKSGNSRSRLTWRLLFLSSGEISLSSHMLEAGKRAKAGQEIRMLDIPADAGCGHGIFEKLYSYNTSALFSDALKLACDKYHGAAGEAFLEKLVAAEPSNLLTTIQNIQLKFMLSLPEEIHGQVKRAAQRFALVAAAGDLATSFDVTGWQPGEAIKAAKACFEAWFASRDGGSGSHEHEVILEQVRHFFQENAARFDIFNYGQDNAYRNIPSKCAGFRESGGDFYVYPKTFRDEICKGLGSYKEIAKIIEEHGWIIPDAKNKTSYSSIWVPTKSKTIRLYHFSGEVIGDGNKK